MRVLLVVLLLLAAPLAAASAQTTTRRYVAAGPDAVVVATFVVGWNGAAAPAHAHDTTVDVAVADALNGPIPAVVCQDADADGACTICLAEGCAGDPWTCFQGSATVPVAAGRAVWVLVTAAGARIPECGNVPGRATAGTVSFSFA